MCGKRDPISGSGAVKILKTHPGTRKNCRRVGGRGRREAFYWTQYKAPPLRHLQTVQNGINNIQNPSRFGLKAIEILFQGTLWPAAFSQFCFSLPHSLELKSEIFLTRPIRVFLLPGKQAENGNSKRAELCLFSGEPPFGTQSFTWGVISHEWHVFFCCLSGIGTRFRHYPLVGV